MHPGYMHRAPAIMNTPLRSLTFPGCVTLGKSLPLSELKVPLLEVKITRQPHDCWEDVLFFCHSGRVVILQKYEHSPPQALCMGCFACLDPLPPNG